jgi:hypothetical protein
MNKNTRKKILDWMKGTDSDMPIMPSTKAERPEGIGPFDPQVRERKAKINESAPKGPAGKETRIFGPRQNNTPSAAFGERLKKESEDFYNSDAGKGDGYSGMFASPNPNRKPHPLPTDGRLDKDYINGYFDNAAKKAKSDNYVTKKDGNMTNKGVDWKSIMADKGDMQKYIKNVPKAGLSDFEKGVIGGAGATAAGGGAAAANSYWSRKKEQDRSGGNK